MDKIETRLMNKAVHYLGRYASSAARLRQVLQRFAARKLLGDKLEGEEVGEAIERVVRQCEALGYVDDVQFMQMRRRAGRAAGLSSRQILARLMKGGIEGQKANAFMEEAKTDFEGSRELVAAFVQAKKKRLGPYARELNHAPYARELGARELGARGLGARGFGGGDLGGGLDADLRQKHFGRLARAGFAMDVVKRVMNCADAGEADAQLEELQNELEHVGHDEKE